MIGNFLSWHRGTKGIGELLAEMLIARGYPVMLSSTRRHRLNRIAAMLWTVIFKQRGYDLAHIDVFSGFAFSWADLISLVLKLLKKPLIMTLRGGKLPVYAQGRLKRVRRVLARADVVTTPSRYLMEEMGAYRRDLVYLPNGLALENYPFQLREMPSPKICWLRAFSETYNPGLAVNTIARLKEDFPEVTLTMFGPARSDRFFREVQQQAIDLGVSENINFYGPIPKSSVPEHLGSSDIFINTTNYESFGVAVMEAAACGLPIVTTSVGELPYLWTDGQDALLVPPDDPEAMAAAVRRLLTEPGLAAKLSRNARRKAENYDWAVILKQWEALFEDLIPLRENSDTEIS